MSRSKYLLGLVALIALALSGCSDQRTPTDSAHTAGWFASHKKDATSNLDGCRVCHGPDLRGGSVGVACSSCHLSDGPIFTIHPFEWTNVRDAHATFADTESWTSCANGACHGSSLRGGERVGARAPSCFSGSFQELGCHFTGPPAPHERPYYNPILHGLPAATTLDYCLNCHGVPSNFFDGGFVADPLITDNSGGSCSACHEAATAHPTNWQGTNDDASTSGYASSHRKVGVDAIADGCALCHNTAADLPGPMAGAPSCFSSSFVNFDGSFNGCHPTGPGNAAHDLPFTEEAKHGPFAVAQGLDLCQTCHGEPGTTRFDGGITGVSCSAPGCHVEVGAHPSRWQGNNDITFSYQSSHQTVPLGHADLSCGICHSTTGPGAGAAAGAPSCFSSSHLNSDGSRAGCHTEGPGTPTHLLPFSAPADHGPVAKGNSSAESGQEFCQTCHGTPGQPDFSGGVTDVGCVVCHPSAAAHPTNWQGTNDNTITNGYYSTHRTSGDLMACALCHATTEGAPSPVVEAPSCFASSHTNRNNSATPCHAGGPGAPHDLGALWLAGSGHGPFAKQDLEACQQCHGTPGTIFFDAGGVSAVSCSTADCHLDARAHPTNWQGANDDATTNGHASTHRAAQALSTACAICHDGPQGGTSPDISSPSCMSTDFTNANAINSACHPTGPGVGHLLPFGDGAIHGPEAKKDLVYCQQCHAAPSTGGAGSNPLFNVPIGMLAQGCEDCHIAGTAHPIPWVSSSRIATHKSFGNKENACVLCHGATLDGTVEGGRGPACLSCHQFGPPIQVVGGDLALFACTSCHNVPPDSQLPPDSGASSGDVRPNREGAHAIHDSLIGVTGVCNTCHLGAGTDTAAHFDDFEPATAGFLAQYDAANGSAVLNLNSTCSIVSCHGGQVTPDWYSGSITVDSDCDLCHELGNSAGSPLANSYYSGRHSTHAEVGGRAESAGFFPSCAACHDPAPLSAAHFTALATPEFEGDPVATIPTVVGYDPFGDQPTCNTSITGCHPGDTRQWVHGALGAPHEVGDAWLLPGNHATSAINASPDCLVAGCHTLTAAGGGEPPSCRSCHTASAPNYTLDTCNSCHGEPPSGASYPNRSQKHEKHKSADCSVCHSGFGTGSLDHYRPDPVGPPADISFDFVNPSDNLWRNSAGQCNGVCHIGGDSKEHKDFNW